MDDVNILADHINALTTKTIKLSNILSQHAKHESTFMHSVDQRISNVVSTISDNHDDINILQKSLNTTTQNLESLFFTLQSKIIKTFSVSTKLEHQLNQLKMGIFLSSGR